MTHDGVLDHERMNTESYQPVPLKHIPQQLIKFKNPWRIEDIYFNTFDYT